MVDTDIVLEQDATVELTMLMSDGHMATLTLSDFNATYIMTYPLYLFTNLLYLTSYIVPFLHDSSVIQIDTCPYQHKTRDSTVSCDSDMMM